MNTSETSPKAQQNSPDPFCTSGPSPTVHVLGAGPVGRCVLRQLRPEDGRLIAVSDRSATLHSPTRLDGPEIAAHKERGAALADLPGSEKLETALALRMVAADVVIDATDTDPAAPGAGIARAEAALAVGSRVVFAAKDSLCLRGAEWIDHDPASIGSNAALGGAGRQLQAELEELRARCDHLAIAGSASTTAIVTAVEGGASLEEGIAAAAARGLLESDPELDFQGVDAAVKLACVVGLLTGTARNPVDLAAATDARRLDPELLRTRARRGHTTRLVGRYRRDLDILSLDFEEVPRGTPLAVPADRVAYLYGLEGGDDFRLHTGAGLGPAATARAALDDLRPQPAREGSR